MAEYTKEQVAATIDHAALKPDMSDTDIKENCAIGKKYKLASVCVRPADAQLAARELDGSGVPVCVVVGFPHGANMPEVKALEAKLAIEAGAKEIDMVMNIGKLKSLDYDWVQKDIEAVAASCKSGGALLKVIIESCLLTPEEIKKACELSKAAGADFVKTSTGFNGEGATPEAIKIMVETVGDTLGVKASGGVRDYETAKMYLDMGCKRLGTAGGTPVIMGEAPEGSAGSY